MPVLSVTANGLLTIYRVAVRWRPPRLRPDFGGARALLGVRDGDGAPRRRTRAHRIFRPLHFLLYLAFLALLVESAAVLLAKLPSTRTVFFSGEAGFVEQLRTMERFYPRFLADRYDGVLGWDNPRATALVKHVCAGHTVTETYLEDRSRRTPAAGGRAILAVGDSFTLGAEVDDDDSYPAQLSRLLDRKVVDHGVGGYCPLQAVLKFRQRASDYPEARTVVLGITSEDIPRMLNSYRPALFPHTAGVFSFKPYMRGAQEQANPNGPTPATFDVLVERVRQALREDYWALPEARFPYSVALFRSLSRPIARLRLLKALGRSRPWLADGDVRVALGALLENFVDSARAVGMAPVVLFMPDKPGHRHAFDDLLPQLRAQFGARAVLAAVRDEGYRWDQYLPNPNCHPGPYGYRMIAEHAARAVRESEKSSRAASLGG